MDFIQGLRDVLLIGVFALVFIVGYANKHHHNQILDAIEVQNTNNYDYEIDLKQDYIIVYSKGGNVDTIPHGKLEAFFERDNM